MGMGILMKIAVYSTITGGYDDLLEPSTEVMKYWFEDVDLVMFTDTPEEFKSDKWEVREIPVFIENERKTSRWPKINSHLVFPDYDYTIYIDGNMYLQESPKSIIEKFLEEDDFACHKNPYRECAYAEAEEVRNVLKYDKKEIVDEEVEFLKSENYPEDNGLAACHLLVRRHTPEVKELNSMWWDMVNKFSYRDQLSFNYCCWKLGMKYKIITPYKHYANSISNATHGHKPNKKVIFDK